MTTGVIVLDCLIAGLLGILCHVFFLKLPALKNTADVSNIHFTPKTYFEQDWIPLVASVLTVVVFAFVLDEVLKIHPMVAQYLKFFFVFIGYTGSSVLQAALGVTDKKFKDIINKKTDIADNKNQ